MHSYNAGMTRPTLHLVDASLYVFRAWHSMPDDFRDDDGWPTNAVHGFARFLLELLERERPRHIAIAFDESLGSNFRHALYPAYKANRDPAPPELKRQFAWCKALCEALGLVTLAHADFEADDLIGSAAHAMRGQGFRSVIVSADKDLSQLLQADDEQYDFGKGQRWGHAGVKARHGVRAEQIADYLALAGDAVDNIPGVTGIGPKSAAVLLSHFGTLDALLERIDEVPFLRLRGATQMAARLREQREQTLLWRRLTTVAVDAPLPEGDFQRARGDAAELTALADWIGFGEMTRKRLADAASL